jgi:hypothetical protein
VMVNDGGFFVCTGLPINIKLFLLMSFNQLIILLACVSIAFDNLFLLVLVLVMSPFDAVLSVLICVTGCGWTILSK